VKLPIEVGVTLWLPEVAGLTVPLQAFEPVQEVAFVTVHESDVLWPSVIEVGVAVRLTVGAGATVSAAVWLEEPPGPVQLRVKL
jgi:hypothetical protein